MGVWRWAGLLAATVIVAPVAQAQNEDTVFNEPNVFNLAPGAHALELDEDQFVEFACGTNGGPPSIPIGGFSDFARCRPEPSGLREVYFRYDDEDEYIARARSQTYQASLFGGTTIYAIAVVVSALFDEGGILQGLRIVSDQKVPVADREMGYTLGNFIKARYHIQQSSCHDLPRLEGETPVGGIFIKEGCDSVQPTGERVHLQTSYYRRPGEVALDRAGIAATSGQFWSEVRLEVLRAPDPAADDVTRARALTLPDRAGAHEALVARAMNCPGCDLSGANLKRADLTNANLRGANLAGATLHGAILSGADLTGANLAGANLNTADLRRAALADADLSLVMAYDARLEGAVLARANFSGGFLGKAQFTRADLSGANLYYADLRHARLSDANLEGTDLTQAWLESALFLRSRLAGAILDGAIIDGAQLRGASLAGASLVDADLYRADFGDADLTNANFSRARVTGTGFRGATLTGAIFD